MLKIALHYSFH